MTEHHLEFLAYKDATQARLSLHLSKCYVVAAEFLTELTAVCRCIKRLIYCNTFRFFYENKYHLDPPCLCGERRLSLISWPFPQIEEALQIICRFNQFLMTIIEIFKGS